MTHLSLSAGFVAIGPPLERRRLELIASFGFSRDKLMVTDTALPVQLPPECPFAGFSSTIVCPATLAYFHVRRTAYGVHVRRMAHGVRPIPIPITSPSPSTQHLRPSPSTSP